jgi:hypothetical protein
VRRWRRLSLVLQPSQTMISTAGRGLQTDPSTTHRTESPVE